MIAIVVPDFVEVTISALPGKCFDGFFVFGLGVGALVGVGFGGEVVVVNQISNAFG